MASTAAVAVGPTVNPQTAIRRQPGARRRWRLIIRSERAWGLGTGPDDWTDMAGLFSSGFLPPRPSRAVPDTSQCRRRTRLIAALRLGPAYSAGAGVRRSPNGHHTLSSR